MYSGLELLLIGALLGVVYPTLSDAIDKFVVRREGVVREPNERELQQIIDGLGGTNPIASTVEVLEESRYVRSDSTAGPVGRPGRQTLLIGADFLRRDRDIVKSALSIERARIENKFYWWDLLAKIVQLSTNVILLLYFLPPVPPSPQPDVSVGLIVGSAIVLLVADRKMRSLVYETDRLAASYTNPTDVVSSLQTIADTTDRSISSSRLAQFFERRPSFENRIRKLREIE